MPPPSPTPHPSPEQPYAYHPRSTFLWFVAGLRESLSVPGFVLFAGYIGYGGLLQGMNFPFFAGLLSTFLVWALPAQIILVGGLASGVGLLPIALAVGLSSMRLLPMVVSLAPYMRSTHNALWKDLINAHFVAMTMWAEGQRLLPKLPPSGRFTFTMGLGIGLLLISISATAIGYQMAGELPPAMSVGLQFLTAISFTLLMIRGAEGVTDWCALAFGFLTTPFVAGLSGGADLMISGLGGGTLAYLIGRAMRRKRA
ncbi:AzlC family ABC transporter permease [Aquabacter sp. CN5-332]|uniref:AzlC family ABC transporter permease n=1 Tax=Aquabacter sp. CN5-332 TaxID=3156608 RepID=UPI0032B41CD7